MSPETTEQEAPYAYRNAVLGLIHRYREGALPDPITPSALKLFGISPNNAHWLLGALGFLGLIDDAGRSTGYFERLETGQRRGISGRAGGRAPRRIPSGLRGGRPRATTRPPSIEPSSAIRRRTGKDWMEKVLGFSAEIIKRPRRWVRVPEGQEPPPYPKGFIVLPRRWVVERSFSWTGQNRRMSKDHERVPETGEALLCVAMSRLMVRRLARL